MLFRSREDRVHSPRSPPPSLKQRLPLGPSHPLSPLPLTPSQRSPLPDSSGRPPFPTCRTTTHSSQLPDLSFPATYLSSPAALAIRDAEAKAGAWVLSRWWRRRTLRAKTLVECRVVMSTKLKEGSEDGWQFVRLLHEDGTDKAGWGVYEMWIGAA